jgi:hypothetical protein
MYGEAVVWQMPVAGGMSAAAGQGRENDHDLHPCPQSGWPGRPQPAGLAYPISRRASGVDLLARPAAPQVHEDTPRVHL